MDEGSFLKRKKSFGRLVGEGGESKPSLLRRISGAWEQPPLITSPDESQESLETTDSEPRPRMQRKYSGYLSRGSGELSREQSQSPRDPSKKVQLDVESPSKRMKRRSSGVITRPIDVEKKEPTSDTLEATTRSSKRFSGYLPRVDLRKSVDNMAVSHPGGRPEKRVNLSSSPRERGPTALSISKSATSEETTSAETSVESTQQKPIGTTTILFYCESVHCLHLISFIMLSFSRSFVNDFSRPNPFELFQICN